ncbi:AIM24 family protein [Paenibacillus mucilaginosus]|uniref:AIM24 family protein n=1 Tax=Paenibacillus mucilaginosus (strain KNP414) TaxID=1036673 RepID=F8FGR4_PAEMK|nr:AIM24 family protein [Paenibacillus mucilaginosus]AEI45441.1 hypothetical protein KNP414_06929 [Paenibacillus mucilaginosus KNP414]MCG7215203.1 AIM24 family protein [Paenibacillus mucilaginosus]WDM26873.1 AIM24 family protein [Paenibacillus mucilaginosus]
MHIDTDGGGSEGQTAAVRLDAGEACLVLRPDQIIAYQGAPQGREDRFLNPSGMYRKKLWVESRLSGPARFVLGVPPGYYLKTLELQEESSLLFDMEHVLFYSENLRLQSRLLHTKEAFVSRDWVRMKFSGGGTLGLVSSGPLCGLTLHPEQPLYVDTGCLVAYPEEAKLRLCVYGNTLASQRMNYQWEITGTGSILVQPAGERGRGGGPLKRESLLRRVLREVLPFGSVWIK